nr:immunoglobulin heavy chain junction region [Macaca mulatta]MOW76174.1 immunoglobulin heavy chain junction region [Macaca mulatta]MOW76420.1 immunoglobulin heavy chain junction region [Macaca mulatta]MOW77119.1 immunoglobulin heavy chain junction region [Macaca mulatta]MOW77238.1 immunoglobulin heavy chain junction region [Macaca mulatta]
CARDVYGRGLDYW